MIRRDRLGFAAITSLPAAMSAGGAVADIASGRYLHAAINVLGALCWARFTYYLWRPRTMRVNLGLGKDNIEHWAEILDVDEMPAKVRRKVRSVIGVEIGPDGKHKTDLNGGLADSMKAALMAAVTKAWSFEKQISVEAIEDLPIKMYDRLAEATEAHSEAVNFSQPETSTDGENSSE